MTSSIQWFFLLLVFDQELTMSFMGMFTSMRELLPEPSTREIYIMFSMFMLVQCLCCLF